MIIILNSKATKEQIDELLKDLGNLGLKTGIINGEQKRIITLIGDITKVNVDGIKAETFVEDIRHISEPFKAANRIFHPNDTTVQVGNQKIGEGHFCIMSGPCSVETEEQIIYVANRVKKAGASMLRGGAFKPRTSPYSFQGLGVDGLKLLLKAKKATGLPIVTELMDLKHLDLFSDIDVIQVGARNMQNFEMLKELGRCNKPILLKRGLSSTIEEWMMSSEYIMSGGNKNVILCERGIRTYETSTRNTLDISAIPMIKKISHLPIIVDPSHATGLTWMVEPLSKAAIAAGADGLMIEVHNCPTKALSDGAQSLDPDQFDDIMKKIKPLISFCGKKLNEA
ncbi:MAG: 3-deoxy-7-phosphoheptulonate synthase [Oscillospiraceae bacterium]|nr:3-deoxy-7-phosphoheptulonate synthase [Oscillospiraceae bacterium]